MSVSPTLDGQDLFGLFDLSLFTQNGMEAWLAETLQRCARWFGASGASVFLASPDGAIRVKSRTGSQIRVPDDAEIKLGQGIAGTVLKSGRPRLVGDPTLDPSLSGLGIAARREIASSMVVPLIGPSGDRVGVMNFSRSAGEQPFDKADLAQAANLGAHVAMAVSNARLVDLLQSSLETVINKSEQLSAVLESVAGSVQVFDPDGSVDGELPTPPVLANEASEAIRSLLASGLGCETVAYDQESDRTWLLHADTLSRGGGVLTIQEVTKFQRAKDEASRLRRLAEIGQMTAGIAHELRNPLTGIRGAAQLIVGEPTHAQEYALIIEEEACKMDRLCSEFLEISKPLRLHLEEARLGDLAANVCSLWKTEFEFQGVALEVRSDPDDPVLSLDARRVEQVVHNLLRNALQASMPGGHVVVEVKCGNLKVTDNGNGMDDDTKSRLFAPFFTTKAQGTGLGLCNVRRIVDAHGGRVDVRSEVGVGSEFEVSFRRNAA